jgi:ElaB/YqjD/DUF883 family membrane-anchored ribosome-binding protein
MANTNNLQEDAGRKASDSGREALGAARNSAGNVADKAKKEAESVGRRLGDFADDVKESVPRSIVEAKDAVVDGVCASGEYLRTHDIDEMSSDVTKLVQKHPFWALGIGAGVGFALGRMMMSK